MTTTYSAISFQGIAGNYNAINGLPDKVDDGHVFHAGTTEQDGKVRKLEQLVAIGGGTDDVVVVQKAAQAVEPDQAGPHPPVRPDHGRVRSTRPARRSRCACPPSPPPSARRW